MTISRENFFEAAATGDLRIVKKYMLNALKSFDADILEARGKPSFSTYDVIRRYEQVLHTTNENIETALHVAAKFGKQEILTYLLQEDERIHAAYNSREDVFAHDRRDVDGNTPLIIAASQGHEGIVATLLAFGPIKKSIRKYASIANDNHRNAVEEALHYKHSNIADLIEREAGIQLALRKSESSGKQSQTFQERLDAIYFKGTIPSQFLCSITRQLINDCIVISQTHVCDRKNLERLFLMQENPEKLVVANAEIYQSTLKYQTFTPMQNLIEQFVRTQEENALKQKQQLDSKQHSQTSPAQDEEKSPSPSVSKRNTFEDLEKAQKVLNDLINQAKKGTQQHVKPIGDTARLFKTVQTITETTPLSLSGLDYGARI